MSGPRPAGSRKKIVSAGDWHIPYHNEFMLDRLLTEDCDADVLFIPGDFFTLENLSRFLKDGREYQPEEEFQAGQFVMQRLASRFAEIKVIPGNHDNRLMRMIQRQENGPMILRHLRMLGSAGLDMLQVVAKPYSNVSVLDGSDCSCSAGKADLMFRFCAQEGDLVLTHAEKYSRIPGQAANYVADWVFHYAMKYGIVKAPVNVVAQAHTHQFAHNNANHCRTLELGCMCNPEPYVTDPRIISVREAMIGYAIFVQYDGITNMDEFRYKELPPARRSFKPDPEWQKKQYPQAA